MTEANDPLQWFHKKIVSLLRKRGRTMKGLHALLTQEEIVVGLDGLVSAVNELCECGHIEFQSMTDSWYLTDKGKKAVRQNGMEAFTRLSVFRRRVRLGG